MRRAIIGFALCLAAFKDEDRFLQWMDSIAQRQLSQREAEVDKVRSAAEAQQRQKLVRAKILELIGGLPDYDGPLNAKITGRVTRPQYTIEKVIFESLPQLYVTANLYRPNAPGRYPGVLIPMGHWMEGKTAAQRIAANLAMKGFVALAYDPLGQGERLQAYDRRLRASLAGGTTDQHFMAGAQAILAGENFARYRIWDAKRALDYLQSRPEVDPEKIGCTGCSGGGTLTTYISALDPRVKVAAPACYISTWRLLFSGPTGDSEQSFPDFISSGLDVSDYIELFAPKPFLIASTVGDFFPIEGARRAFQEAQGWYKLFDAEQKIKWAVGPGGHGTPIEIREAIYDWMIRWLKDGRGNSKEEPVDMAPDFELRATNDGQVEGREIYQIIAEGFQRRKSHGTQEQMLAELRRITKVSSQGAPAVRVLNETPGGGFRSQEVRIESEPGLEITGTLYLPNVKGSKPGLLLVDSPAELAKEFAQRGAAVLNLRPRGVPAAAGGRLVGDWIANTRAWLIGRNLPGMRASDIIRGVDLLTMHAAEVRAVARGAPGVWLLIATALDPRISRIWLDRTPRSLRQAFENAIHRDLHDAVIPGFALRWDLEDIVKAIAPRKVIWSDPTDWMGVVTPAGADFLYRSFEEPDDRFVAELLLGK
ncbi:MAG TPA: acetylxylan esterase [Anaerolineales bacterium]